MHSKTISFMKLIELYIIIIYMLPINAEGRCLIFSNRVLCFDRDITALTASFQVGGEPSPFSHFARTSVKQRMESLE